MARGRLTKEFTSTASGRCTRGSAMHIIHSKQHGLRAGRHWRYELLGAQWSLPLKMCKRRRRRSGTRPRADSQLHELWEPHHRIVSSRVAAVSFFHSSVVLSLHLSTPTHQPRQYTHPLIVCIALHCITRPPGCITRTHRRVRPIDINHRPTVTTATDSPPPHIDSPPLQLQRLPRLPGVPALLTPGREHGLH